MGRKAIPAHLQLLGGNKNRLPKAELEKRIESEQRLRPKTDDVKPPTWLNSVAKREFKRIAKELSELDLLTNIDVNALAAYCDAYADYIECTKIIREEGLLVEYTNKAAETNKVPHPLLTKKKQLHDQMRSLAMEFGLTPSSRAKLAMPRSEAPTPKSKEERLFGDKL